MKYYEFLHLLQFHGASGISLLLCYWSNVPLTYFEAVQLNCRKKLKTHIQRAIVIVIKIPLTTTLILSTLSAFGSYNYNLE